MKKKIIIAIACILVAIQFIRPNMENPEVDSAKDYINITQPNEKIAAILKTSCYDCHSNETEYMWYMQIAPISWWTMYHVNEGRDELNFSNWDEYKLKRQKHKLDECVEMIEEDEMPLSSYTIIHSKASLNENQKSLLMDLFKNEIGSIIVE